MRYAEICDRFTTNGVKHYRIAFIPDITIDCDPAYEKGRETTTWIARTTVLPKPTDKGGWQRVLGMSLQPFLEED